MSRGECNYTPLVRLRLLAESAGYYFLIPLLSITNEH